MPGIWDQIVAALRTEFGDLPDVEAAVRVIVRLGVALLLGGLLGWQRERAGKAAGLRTHMLVCLGAALFVAGPQLAGMTTDGVSRIIQGLTTGIGFVGAGAILKLDSPARIHGLTTAAGIWLTAAIGVTAGMGREMTAILATAIALAVLWTLRRKRPRPAEVAPPAPPPPRRGKRKR